MNEGLSILAAAREAPATVALHDGDRRFTFAEVGALVQRRVHELAPALAAARFHPLVGAGTLEALVTLYALLEARVPALLLHPKLTATERAAEIDATRRAAETLPADAAAILYTSGTTGRPRGVVLTAPALLASALASSRNLGWQPDDCWLLALPIARVGGLSIVTRSLAARRPVALEGGFDAAQVPRWIDAHRATLVSLVPTMLALTLERNPAWRPPPHLRAVLVGGAAAPARLLARARELQLPIVTTYGCTETCSQVAATPYEARFDPARCGVGRPLDGVELRVTDGRIEVRGPMRMAGYLGAPPLPPDAWFDTGDLGQLDAAGCLHLLARRSDLIVSGGENVYPAEVERVLEACPGIGAAAVFGLPDDTWGQVVAAALVRDGDPPSDAALAAFLAERLARHKHPRRIAYVPRLPLTPAGKLDRAALAALAPALEPLQRAPLAPAAAAGQGPRAGPTGSG